MKALRLVLLGIFMVCALGLSAQPVIMGDFWLEPNETSTLVPCDTAGVMNGTPGANQNWDYTGLTMNAGIYLPQTNFYWKGVDLSSAPYAADFPSAMGGYFQDDSVLSYMRHLAGQIEWIGFVGVQPGAILRSFYTDGEQWVRVPLSYQDAAMDTFYGIDTADINISGKIAVPFYGRLNWEADAHGTLRLPNATYNNVLRVKLIRSRTSNPPTGQTTADNENYLYFSATHEFIILDIENIFTDNPNPVPDTYGKRVFYADNPPMSNGTLPRASSIKLPEYSKIDFIKVFPNPAIDRLDLQYYLIEKGEVQISLHDLSGKEVLNIRDGEISAGNLINKSIDIGHLASGVYQLSLILDDETSTIKVIVE